VEVVTGGASAAWGSDAVAGVVNVILRKDIDGFEGEAEVGSTAHDDNRELRLALSYGARFADDRGSFLISGEYEDNDGIGHQSDRSWANGEWGIVNNPNYTATNGQFARLISPHVRANNGTRGGLILSGVLAGTQFGPGGAPLAYNPGSYALGLARTIGGDGPAPQQDLTLLVPLERYTLFTRASFDISDKLSVFVEGGLSQSNTVFDLVDNFHPGNFTIRSDNPFLPSSLRSVLQTAGQTTFQMGRLDSDFGPIHEVAHNAARHIVVGLEGRLNADWTWDAHYQYGDDRVTLEEQGILRPANFALAVDTVLAPNGQVACRSTLTNPTDGCQPLNPFGQGSPSAASIGYVTGNGHRLTVISQHAVSASTQGKLFSTWAGPISVAAGLDYRKDELDQRVDPLSQANAFLIGNPKNFGGEISVKEVFGEAVIPLLKDAPLAKSLELNVADRYVDYSTIGGANSWKVGLNYTVTDELRFRGTRSRDIRAPNQGELFSFGGATFGNLRDPVTNSTPFVQIVRAPNPDLDAEFAHTTTVGVVYTPAWLPGFQASVDLYRISIKGVIATIGAQDFIDRCQAGNAALCGAITRNAQNQIVSIQAGRVNLAELFTSGLDLEAQYVHPVTNPFTGAAGQLTLQALGTYTDKLTTDDGVTRIDRAGQVGGNGLTPGGGKPHWMANGSVGYDSGPLGLIANIRYVGGGVYDATFGPRDINIPHFSSRTYLDLGFRYAIRDSDAGRLEAFGRVNNVFDRDPPIIPNPDSLFATNSALYDTIGRTFLLGVRFRH
ncbi:MAG: TonB-dependent receptor domain-containing protein, partial [Phenylobacterium sp.]